MNAEDVVARGYDAVYAALPKSATLLRIWREHALIPDYPEGFEPISFVDGAELRRMAEELRLVKGDALVDLACGLAGPSLWIARERGASLTGVDLSPVAVAQAAERARTLGLEGRARFMAGSFAEAGLADASADGCMSIDALQYAPDKRAAFAEMARILRPGGRLVFTAFELDGERCAQMPVLGEDPVSDYRPQLEVTGFEVTVYEQTRDWHGRLTRTYEALIAAGPAVSAEMGQEAWGALQFEMALTLERQPYCGRAFVGATRS
jgi:SAM-dependent methyltransferase